MNHEPNREEENQKWNRSLFSLPLEGPPSSLTILKVVLELVGATCNMTKAETLYRFKKKLQEWAQSWSSSRSNT